MKCRFKKVEGMIWTQAMLAEPLPRFRHESRGASVLRDPGLGCTEPWTLEVTNVSLHGLRSVSAA